MQRQPRALVGALVVCGLVLAGVTGFHARSARACSWIIPEQRFFRFEAPPGGLWWIHGSLPRETGIGDALELLEAGGGEPISAEIVSVGLQTSIALRVPAEASVGARYLLPDLAELPMDGTEPTKGELVVVEGTPRVFEEPPSPPALDLEIREVRGGYAGLLVWPFGGMCAQSPGLWTHIYREGAFVVTEVPDDVVLDVTVRPAGEPAFEEVTSANQIVFDARRPGLIDERLMPPPGTETDFVVHARLRRLADGAASEVVSMDVTLSAEEEERIEWVGCAASPGSPVWGLAVLLLLFRRARRVRR